MKEIVEIQGVKLEIDTREAKTIESYKVGDKIKVLEKQHGNDYKVWAGIIVGFEMFKELPTMVICYLHQDYREASIKFKYFNSNTTDFQLCHAEAYDIPYNTESMLRTMDQGIQSKERELEVLRSQKAFFLEHFDKYFSQLLSPEIVAK